MFCVAVDAEMSSPTLDAVKSASNELEEWRLEDMMLNKINGLRAPCPLLAHYDRTFHAFISLPHFNLNLRPGRSSSRVEPNTFAGRGSPALHYVFQSFRCAVSKCYEIPCLD